MKRATQLSLPYNNEESIITPNTIIQALGASKEYDRIYTFSVQEKSKHCQLIAAAVGKIAEEVWITSGGGLIDQVVICNEKNFNKRVEIINQYYSDLLRIQHISPFLIRNVDLFQKVQGDKLFRYFKGCLDWEIDGFEYDLPWGLEESEYEKKRYASELNMLRTIKWERLIEVGGCEGYFTELLCKNFPDRAIISFEPDKYFFLKLKKRLGNKIRVINGDCSSASGISTDVLFISNVLYYCRNVPDEIFDTDAKYVVVSHDFKYHEEILDKIFISNGFMCINEFNLDACIERMEGLLATKYGTNIKIWCRNRDL